MYVETRKESSGGFLSWVFDDGEMMQNEKGDIKEALDEIKHPLNLRKLSAPVDERWDAAEKWTSSQELINSRGNHHGPPPGTWSSMLKCTLFGLKCEDENAPTPSPTSEPTLAPTWSDDHWNKTSITECHFFGLYCTDVEVPDTPEPSREPTGRARRDDDYMYVETRKESSGGFLSWVFDNVGDNLKSSSAEKSKKMMYEMKHPLNLRNPIDMHEKLMKKEMDFMAE